MDGWLLVTENLEDLEQTRQYLEDQELQVRVLPQPSAEAVRYNDYPGHPLFGVDANILKLAREVILESANWGEVAVDMIDPIADAVVMRLREAGWLP